MKMKADSGPKFSGSAHGTWSEIATDCNKVATVETAKRLRKVMTSANITHFIRLEIDWYKLVLANHLSAEKLPASVFTY